MLTWCNACIIPRGPRKDNVAHKQAFPKLSPSISQTGARDHLPLFIAGNQQLTGT